MSSMKLGIDCHNLEGARTGVGRYLANLLREWRSQTPLLRQGFGGQANPKSQTVEKFFLYFKNEIPRDVDELISGVQGWTSRNLNRKSNAIFKHWVLPRAAAKDGVEVLFCPDYVLPLYVGGSTPHIKTAVMMHDIIYEARPEEYSWPSWKDKILLKWASKRSSKNADIIFVPSEFTKREVLTHYNVDPAKVIVIPLAADPVFHRMIFDTPAGQADLARFTQKYRIQDKYIFFVGSIFNRRFLPAKIRAFSLFGKDHPDFQFFIVGNNRTNPDEDIRALVAQTNKNLGRRAVIWEQYLSDDKELALAYNRAYATLWLSSYEGFGLPVLESMACGTPVITSRNGSLPEIGGAAALYVEHPKDEHEIVHALTCIVQDTLYYDTLAKDGISHAQKFSWQETAHETLKHLEKIAHRA